MATLARAVYTPQTTQDVDLAVQSLAVDLLVEDIDDLLDSHLLLAFNIEGFGDLENKKKKEEQAKISYQKPIQQTTHSSARERKRTLSAPCRTCP